ncbi:MAG: hypothetical protein A3E88_06935 [Legionellales bacterium RIFCSPHIGHO2_12_FULL_35_11]|nr:MAG: hypothetical protein A3E88_06935 [Legionellales bacterium RIFCSPHIGHO2_12_FULL_35_11]
MIIRVINSISTVISRVVTTVSYIATESSKIALWLSTIGYNSATKLTIDSSRKINNSPPTTGVFLFIATSLLFPVTLIPGFIVGMFPAPILYFTLENIYQFYSMPLKLLFADKITKNSNRLNYNFLGTNFDFYFSNSSGKYSGGPGIAYIFGIPGVILGLTFGTLLAIPYSILRVIDVALKTFIINLVEGVRLAQFDLSEENKISSVNLNLTIQEKLFSALTFGIPLGIFGFSLGASVTTFIRVFHESIISLSNTFNKFYNLSVWDLPKEFHSNLIKNRTFYKKSLGLPGQLLGLPFGLAIFVIITTGRSIYYSSLNFIKAFSKFANYPLQDSDLENIFEVENVDLTKLNYKRHILGFPGILLWPVASSIGLVTGISIRIARESWRNFYNSFSYMINESLRGENDNDNIALIPDIKTYEKIIGGIGLVLGNVVALPFATLISTYLNGRNAFNYLTHTVLSNQTASTLDKRNIIFKILGVPGTIIGTAFGGVVRSGYESTYSAVNLANYLVKKTLYLTNFYNKPYLNPMKENRELLDRALGFPGDIIGLGIGTAIVSLVLGIRYITINGYFAKVAFSEKINGTKFAQRHPSYLVNIDQNSPYSSIYLRAIGFIGYAFGFVLGETWAISLESVVGFEHIFKEISNNALVEADEYKLKTEIQKSDIDYKRGSFGIAVGAMLGSVSFIGIGVSRILINSAITVKHTTQDMIYFVLSEEVPKQGSLVILSRLQNQPTYSSDNNENSRKDLRKKIPFRLGLLGLPIGGVTGSVATIIVGFARIIKESVIKTINDAAIYTSWALPKEYRLTNNLLKQKSVSKVLGTPIGIPLGVVLGLIGFSITLSARIIADTVISAYITASNIIKAWPLNYDYIIVPKDKRNTEDKVLGIPGNLLGLGIGLLGFSLHFCMRIVYDSAITAYLIISKSLLWSVGNEKNYILGYNKSAHSELIDSRIDREKYGFGMPGYAFWGLGIGLSAAIISFRLVRFNLTSAIFIGIDKSKYLFLPAKYNTRDNDFDNNKNNIQVGLEQSLRLPDSLLSGIKYVLGSPGIVIGASLATVFFIIPIWITEIIFNNYESFISLSKSLINIGLEEIYYEKSSQDDRLLYEKIIGSPGYLLSVGVFGVFPIARIVYNATFVVISVASSVIVAPIKALSNLIYPRFVTDDTSNSKEQNLRNLYSSLESGNFSGKQIEIGKSGRKGPLRFFEKSLVFNISTIAEDVLDAVKKNMDKPNQNEFVNTIDSIKQKNYPEFYKLGKNRQDARKIIDDEVEDTKKFISNYVENPNSDVLFTSNRERLLPSYSELYYGVKVVNISF